MVPTAANGSNAGGPEHPSRICEMCEGEMTHLSDLQPMLTSAPLRVFRCYVCNHVASQEH